MVRVGNAALTLTAPRHTPILDIKRLPAAACLSYWCQYGRTPPSRRLRVALVKHPSPAPVAYRYKGRRVPVVWDQGDPVVLDISGLEGVAVLDLIELEGVPTSPKPL
jgi:hypothetical protein